MQRKLSPQSPIQSGEGSIPAGDWPKPFAPYIDTVQGLLGMSVSRPRPDSAGPEARIGVGKRGYAKCVGIADSVGG